MKTTPQNFVQVLKKYGDECQISGRDQPHYSPDTVIVENLTFSLRTSGEYKLDTPSKLELIPLVYNKSGYDITKWIVEIRPSLA